MINNEEEDLKCNTFKFDNNSLKIAVKLWLTDKEIALDKYGDINNWGEYLSEITDMSFLFADAYNFNDDIFILNHLDIIKTMFVEPLFDELLKLVTNNKFCPTLFLLRKFMTPYKSQDTINTKRELESILQINPNDNNYRCTIKTKLKIIKSTCEIFSDMFNDLLNETDWEKGINYKDLLTPETKGVVNTVSGKPEDEGGGGTKIQAASSTASSITSSTATMPILSSTSKHQPIIAFPGRGIIVG